MTTIYRPEKQTDPDKLPGQIVNAFPEDVRVYGGARGGPSEKHLETMAEYIKRVQEFEATIANAPPRRSAILPSHFVCRCNNPVELCEACPNR